MGWMCGRDGCGLLVDVVCRFYVGDFGTRHGVCGIGVFFVMWCGGRWEEMDWEWDVGS